MKGWITGLCYVLALFLFFSCGSEKKTEETAVDLPQIQERKELVVLTVNSSVSYFHYRGEPMGFQYELAQQFAKSLGLDLKVKVVKDEEQLVSSLLKGEAGGKFCLRDLLIDYDTRQVFVGKEEVDLTQTEYNIMAFLSVHAGKVLTYAAIIRAVWGYSDYGSVKKLQVNMKNIRKKMGVTPGEKRYIINELGVGYRMLAEDE